MKRRNLLKAGFAVALPVCLPAGFMHQQARGAMGSGARSALTRSSLVYLTPIRKGGALSRCQAEVWYVMLGEDLYVCTATSSWRARAPRMGVTDTRLWVGDLGVWTRANYQALPSIDAVASVETDQADIEAALVSFSKKYAAEWGRWGPRFRKGLADGSRTMLKYVLKESPQRLL